MIKSKFNITAPPSKSFEQRLLAASLLSQKECIISNVGNSEDIAATREIVKSLGTEIEFISPEKYKIIPQPKDIEKIFLDCRESGFCARFFPAVAMLFTKRFTITGKGSLLQRPIVKSFDVLAKKSCIIESNGSFLPAVFKNCILLPDVYLIDGSHTSQFTSGLLMALPVLKGNSTIISKNTVSIDYLLLTIKVMNLFGVKIYFSSIGKDYYFDVPGDQKYLPGEYTVEGDWSSVATLIVGAAIISEICFYGLNFYSLQADRRILDVLKVANVNFIIENQNLRVSKSEIKSFEFDATHCPDLIPAISILAVFGDSVSKIKGAKRLIHKESNRAEALKNELSKVGVNVSLEDDFLIIEANKKLKSAMLDSYNDHRLAMAFSILEIFTQGKISVNDKNCVKKSYPNYFEDLKKLM